MSDPSRAPTRASPDDASRARRKRKRRDPCEAHRSDGRPCGAKAILGGRVCEAHGGSAPQVRITAGRRLRQERIFEALQELNELERGTERWYQACERLALAERDLVQYESDLDLIALMKVELADPSSSGVRDRLLEIARDRLAGKPWLSPLRAKDDGAW